MLTDKDVAFMQQARKQATAGRSTPIFILYEIDNGFDEWTGEPMLQVIELPVDAIITETAAGGGVDLQIANGITVDKADIQASVGFDQLEGYAAEKPQAIMYHDEKYIVLAADRKGIGKDNRLEVLARKAVI